jgi:hypothetical protein
MSINNKNTFNLINNDVISNGNDNENNNNTSNINGKNEIIINFSKKLSGPKKHQPICANYNKSEKKNVFVRHGSGDGTPILVSRSPGRLTSKSKLEGFYSFVPLEKNNKKKVDNNKNKTKDKILVSHHDHINNKNKFSDKYQYKNSKCKNEEENEIYSEYSSNTNTNANNRRTSFCINKVVKRMKTLSKEAFQSNSKKMKINSSKVVTNNLTEESNFQRNKKIEDRHSNNNLLYSTNNIIINNSSNSYDNKTKKELQEFINNQLKNNKPNFSRINMNGYGIQYLCSYLHKNPKSIYKEIKLLGCNLNDDDLFMLIRTLLDHDTGLLVLNLSSNKITDDSASNIMEFLKECKTLKGLSLYNNMIGNNLKEKLKGYAKLERKNLDNVQLYI